MKNWKSAVSFAIVACTRFTLLEDLSGQTTKVFESSIGLHQPSNPEMLGGMMVETSGSALRPSRSVRSYDGWSTASPKYQPHAENRSHREEPSSKEQAWSEQAWSEQAWSEQAWEGSAESESVVYASYFQSQGLGDSPGLPPPQFANFQVPNPQVPNPQVPVGQFSNPQFSGQQFAQPQHTQPQYASSVPPHSQPSSSTPATSGLRLRNEADGNMNGQSPVLPQSSVQQFTTGLPFVTPAPGRYPTSPYMGPRNVPTYQTVGYQRVMPVSAGGLPSGAAMNANLPQYQTPQFQTTAFQNPTFSSNPAPGYYSAGYQQCQVMPPPSLPPDGVIGQTYIPPTITPNWNPSMYSANNSGFRPLFSLGQENYNVVLGRGIIGQPTAYVPGQYIRNFFRYLSP